MRLRHSGDRTHTHTHTVRSNKSYSRYANRIRKRPYICSCWLWPMLCLQEETMASILGDNTSTDPLQELAETKSLLLGHWAAFISLQDFLFSKCIDKPFLNWPPFFSLILFQCLISRTDGFLLFTEGEADYVSKSKSIFNQQFCNRVQTSSRHSVACSYANVFAGGYVFYLIELVVRGIRYFFF